MTSIAHIPTSFITSHLLDGGIALIQHRGPGEYDVILLEQREDAWVEVSYIGRFDDDTTELLIGRLVLNHGVPTRGLNHDLDLELSVRRFIAPTEWQGVEWPNRERGYLVFGGPVNAVRPSTTG